MSPSQNPSYEKFISRPSAPQTQESPDPDTPPGRKDYLRNQPAFEEFYHLQEQFARVLALHPALVRTWLGALRPRDDSQEAPPTASKSWRTSRLSGARQRELSGLIAQAEATTGLFEPLAQFLLTALPVSTYFAIVDHSRPSQAQWSAEGRDLYRWLERKRNELFDANYGLAKSAVRGRQSYDELLSAASMGLLEAIDRYEPFDPNSSSFAYFAKTYWIRFHITRYLQKNGATVSLSINQQRIVKKIDRFLAERRQAGLPVPTELEVCTALKITPDAYYWYHQTPVMVSFADAGQAQDGSQERGSTIENSIASPEPKPDQILEDNEIANYLRELMRQNIPAHRRVMLSYHRRIGNLADAVEDYLADLETLGLETLRRRAAARKHSLVPLRRLILLKDEEDLPAA